MDDDRIVFTRDGFTYVCKFAPARVATRCGFRVAAVLAPVLQGLAKLKSADGAFSAALIYLFTNPQLEENVVSLCDAFAPYTEIIVENSNPPVSYTLGASAAGPGRFDTHFAGHQDVMFDWLGRVLQQNCSSFLSGLLAKSKDAERALAALQATKASTSPAAAEKTG